jgi:hypothetical protein
VSRRSPLALAGALVALAIPATAQAQAEVTPDQATKLGHEAYRYGIPLLEMLRIRTEMTSVRAPDERGNAPVNMFSHARKFATPRDRTVVAPNVDTLYSLAHLDLGKGPIVLSHPDMGSRYFDFEFVDPYTNVLGYEGTRVTGTHAGKVAIVWTKGGKPAPRGMRVIRSPYRRVWAIGRTLATDTAADRRRAHRKQLQYRLSPSPRLRTGKPGKPKKAPLPKDGLAWLRKLDRALAQNPPPKRDKPLLTRLRAVGVGAGLDPAKAGLSDAALAALKAAVEDEAATILNSSRTRVAGDALGNNGWLVLDPKVGRYGTDYDLRAVLAILGIGANTPEEAIYPTALADSGGRLLDGANRYRLVFPKQPPARAFWSLTLYDANAFLVPNSENRYALGPFHPPLRKRADGSIVVLVQHDKPAEKGVNWLPSPASGMFRLNLRLYWPRKVALDGTWHPPPVERLP